MPAQNLKRQATFWGSLTLLCSGCATQTQVDQLSNSVWLLQNNVAQLEDKVNEMHGDMAQLQGNSTQIQTTVTQLQANSNQLQGTVSQLRDKLDTAVSGTAKLDLQDVIDDHVGNGNQQPRELYTVPANKYAEVRVVSLERSNPMMNFSLQLGTSGYYSYGSIIHNPSQPPPILIAGVKISTLDTPIVLDAGQKITCQIVNSDALKWKLSYHILIIEYPLTGAI